MAKNIFKILKHAQHNVKVIDNTLGCLDCGEVLFDTEKNLFDVVHILEECIAEFGTTNKMSNALHIMIYNSVDIDDWAYTIYNQFDTSREVIETYSLLSYRLKSVCSQTKVQSVIRTIKSAVIDKLREALEPEYALVFPDEIMTATPTSIHDKVMVVDIKSVTKAKSKEDY